MTARYRSREKIRVTLTLMPALTASVIADSPSAVAGILTYRLGRSTVAHSSRAISAVAAGSRLSRGSTSMDTHPSRPAVCSWTGARTSHAARTSSVVTVNTAASTLASQVGQAGQLVVVAVAVGQGGGEDRRVRGHPDHVPGGDQRLQAAAGQQLARQVIQPHRHPRLAQVAQRVMLRVVAG